MNYSTLSPESETCSRSPAISSTAFHAQPPDLRFASLIDMGFATIGPLARRSRLRSGSSTLARVFAPRFLQTPPRSDALALRYPSPPSGWDGTFTRQLSNMHGVQSKTGSTWLPVLVLLFVLSTRLHAWKVTHRKSGVISCTTALGSVESCSLQSSLSL